MNIKKWLQTRIIYSDTLTIKNILDELFKGIIYWIDTTPSLEYDYHELTFKHKFYSFIYKTYYIQNKYDFVPYDEDMYLYFTMKFSQNIIDLFFNFKETTRQYNLSLFHNYKDISLDLEQFLFNHILIEDPYNDEYDESEYENNYIENNIYESDL